MKTKPKTLKKQPKGKPDLAKRLKKVQETPAGFGLFVAIHDFVESIEQTPTAKAKLSKDNKYIYLKQIYQGVEDTATRTNNDDLGHERYMVLNDMNRIQKQELSDSNSFWKKREAIRKIATEVYERLNPPPVVAKK